MRILLVDQFGELGGAQHGALQLAAGFAARGWTMDALIPEGPLVRELAELGANVVPLACGPFTSVRKGAADALLLVRQLPSQAAAITRMAAAVDVIYVNGPRVLPAVALGAGATPWLFHAHSVVAQTSAARLAARSLRKPETRVIACSRFVARWLEELLPGRSVPVIYNGVSSGGARRARSRVERIGVLGRIAPEKGQLDFVRAARMTSGLRFVVCGGAMFAARSYADQVQSEAGPETTFQEWTTDTAGFFDNIDLLVVPSEPVDAGPRVILEAFAAGVPVLAFAVGGIPELVDDGVSGILVKERTPRALAEAIQWAVRDPERLQRLASNARARWKERFTLGRFQEEVAAALEEAAGRAHRVSARAL